MTPANLSRSKRNLAAAPSASCYLPIVLSALVYSLLFGPIAAHAEVLHPEAFAGAVSARTNGEVSLAIESGAEFGREEELWVYQKRDSIQIGGVTVKVNWARIGKIRVESFAGDSATAMIVEEYSGPSIAVGDEVGRLPNTPPMILSIVTESNMVRPRHEISIFIRAADDERDPLTYSAEITGGTLLGAKGPSPVMKWIAPARSGIYYITVTVDDGKGGTTQKKLAMEVPVIREADPYSLAYAVGGNTRAHWQFGEVTDIEMDAGDNMWVLDAKDRLLRVNGPTGVEIGRIDLTFGRSATGLSPSRISLAGDDQLYVLDASRRSLQKLDRTGKRVADVFDASSRKSFLLEAPSDVESSGGGDLFVTDSAGGHVSVIDESGRFVLLFAPQGTGRGRLMEPVSITTNRYGDIFVLDSAKGEILEFDRAFRFRASYKCPMAGAAGEILAHDPSGNLYVLDSAAGSVRKLEADGKLRAVIVPTPGKDSAGPPATSIAVRSDGYILVGTENASIWEHDPSGTLRGILGEENFGKVPDIAVSDDGQMFVLDSAATQVNRFDRHRWLKGRFGARGKYEGQFVNPSRVSVDGEGNCYVFDDGGNRIQKFYAHGVFAKVIPVGEEVAGGLRDAVDIDVTRDGSIYILDSKRKAVFIVTREGELKKIVPLTSSDARKDKQIKGPRDIAVDGDGYIYVSDPLAYAVYKFHPDGTRTNKLGGKGKEPGRFGKVGGLAADGKGFVYVLLKDRKVVAKFSRDGRFIMEIPLAIDEDTPLKNPECIAVDTYGALYAFDNYYKAVFKFMQ